MRYVALALFLLLPTLAQPLPVSTPDKEGFSKDRLDRIHKHFQQLTDSGQRPGAVTMVVRNGRIVDWQAYGIRDIENKLPMEKDTICRIYSMTKPITSVAIMMLVEEGKITLDDPVSKFIPEFKNFKVYKSGTADRPELADPIRPMTVRHLLTHTSGLTYGWSNDNVATIYQRAKYFEVASLKEFIEKISKLPLASSPGEKYEYSISIDVLGYLVQVASGLPFDQFVQQRILDPLKMKDTHFVLPEAKRSRLAKIYTLKDGKLTEQPGLDAKGVPFGGMGLFSTIADYSRFAQMLVNSGELDGARLLSRKTVELMTVNHLGGLAKPNIGGDEGDGFGLGGAVRIDIAKAGRPASLGTFGWDGAASTYFRVDRKEKMAILLFTQWMPFDKPLLNLYETLAYQSLVD